MEFEKKRIVITGATAGIGRALAEKLSSIECSLLLTGRRTNLLDEFKSKPCKARVEIIKCDTGNFEEVKAAYDYAYKCFGGIDIAILNAGIGMPVTVEKFSARGAEETMQTNFISSAYWSELLLKDFIARKEGMIVGVSSLADNRAYGATFYNASKAALTIFLEGLRLDLKKYNVKVLTVRPGFVETGMTAQNKFKMPFLLSTAQAAEIILRGIEKEKKIIQFPWQMVLLTRFIGLLPLTVYEFLIGRGKK